VYVIIQQISFSLVSANCFSTATKSFAKKHSAESAECFLYVEMVPPLVFHVAFFFGGFEKVISGKRSMALVDMPSSFSYTRSALPKTA